MTKIDQVRSLEEAGISFAGFIFYPKSPRYVEKSGLQAADLKRERININRVGVFVNASAQEILKTVDEWRLHMVQLHGDESPKFCEIISNHITTIKAFRMSADDNVGWKIYPYMDVVDMFLFDAVGVGYGGTGQQFDWKMLDSATIGKSFFLSGGIGPSDVQAVRDFSAGKPEMFAVDINSKFEIGPGDKDIDKIIQFKKDLDKP
ncbi:phosphoribosylanthranilate isomerase [Pollutibacter soli]|uniref:phosphoribosylanthranilate isomerase n=1 Tax=Pollutibacter soli TaxID=3034157 RepID=UPI0030132AB1